MRLRMKTKERSSELKNQIIPSIKVCLSELDSKRSDETICLDHAKNNYCNLNCKNQAIKLLMIVMGRSTFLEELMLE
jgi:hypothetical protein